MSEYLLEVEELYKRFDEEVVIDHLSLNLLKHEFLCILGPSGCGKSTLLRCIASFEAYEGTIRLMGEEKKKPSTDCMMVFQDYNQLFPWMTVEKNICLALRKRGIKDRGQMKEIVNDVLQKVKLSGCEKKYPFQLSGGMKQRVAIAKALALKPKLILMDEPFAALDAISRNTLQAELWQIYHKEDISVIFVTHNIQEAIVLGTRILVMSKDNRIIYDERNIIEKPTTPASKGYGEYWDCLHSVLYDGVEGDTLKTIGNGN